NVGDIPLLGECFLKKVVGSLLSFARALGAFSIALILVAAPLARAEVKVGDVITAANAEQVRTLVSPGAFIAVAKGMQMNIVAPGRIDWPPPYQNATEKYAGQVQLAP